MNAALLAALALAATPSPSPAALRHLVFSVKVEITRSGVPTVLKDRGGTTPIMQSAIATKGRIICDVIAFDKDGDLVVDVSEDATDRVTPVRRVLLRPDGTTSYAASAVALNEEEAALLRLLARGTIGSAARDAGAQWTLQNAAGSDTTTTNYRVTGVHSKDEVDIAIDQDEESTGAAPFSAKTTATVVFDPPKNVPTGAKYVVAVKLKGGAEGQALDYQIELGLLEDSFGR